MNKAEYLSLKDQNLRESADLKKDLIDLNSTYIETNREYEIGQKVIVTDKEKNEIIGFISHISVEQSSGELNYHFFIMKNNGDPSRHSIWLLHDETIRAFKPTEL